MPNPWWDLHSPDLQVQMQWRTKVLKRIENDFLELPLFYTREEREVLAVEQNRGEVLLIDRRTGKATRLEREPIGGDHSSVAPFWRLSGTVSEVLAELLAAHLLKAVHWWTDIGLGSFNLYYLRDKAYYCEAHIERSRNEAEHTPCCLCGEIHPLRVHANLFRKILRFSSSRFIVSRRRKEGGSIQRGCSRPS